MIPMTRDQGSQIIALLTEIRDLLKYPPLLWDGDKVRLATNPEARKALEDLTPEKRKKLELKPKEEK